MSDDRVITVADAIKALNEEKQVKKSGSSAKYNGGKTYSGKKWNAYYQEDIPTKDWQVHTNRNRLYLWTHDDNNRRDTKLFMQLKDMEGVRVHKVDENLSFLYLDYEHRARELRKKDPNADISQSALEKPFLNYVKPDEIISPATVERGFTDWLMSHENIQLKKPIQVGHPAVRGDFYEGGKKHESVMAHISEYDPKIRGYNCVFTNFYGGKGVGYCNEFNHFSIASVLNSYHDLQKAGLRSRSDMSATGLSASDTDPVTLIKPKGNTHVFANDKERDAFFAEQEKLRLNLEKLENERKAQNIQTLAAFFKSQPKLNDMDKTHVSHGYFVRKQIAPLVAELPDIKATNGARLEMYIDSSEVKEPRTIPPAALVPMYNLNAELAGAQVITNNDKKNAPGVPSKALLYAFPSNHYNDKNIPLVVTEGFATAASLSMALSNVTDKDGRSARVPVVCAWSCGNLQDIVKVLGERFDKTPIIIAADNDEKGPGKPNPGIEEANKVKGIYPYRTTVLVPSLDGVPFPSPQDFNDRHALFGLKRLQEEIAPHFEKNYGIKIGPALKNYLDTQPQAQQATQQQPQAQQAAPVQQEARRSREEITKAAVAKVMATSIPGKDAGITMAQAPKGFVLRADMRWNKGVTVEAFPTVDSNKPEQMKINQGIVIPLRNLKGELNNVAILQNNNNRFSLNVMKGTSVDGNYYPLNVSKNKSNTFPVIIAQSYQDAQAINTAFKHSGKERPTVFVAFTEKNMHVLAQDIWKSNPNKHIALVPNSSAVLNRINQKGNHITNETQTFVSNNADKTHIILPISGNAANADNFTNYEMSGRFDEILQAVKKHAPQLEVSEKKHLTPGNN